MTQSETTDRRAPIALWRIAAEFLNILYNLFGSSAEIAQRHTLTARTRALMLPWIRAGEALVRRLLLIEASHYAKDELRPAPTRARQPRMRKAFAFDPAHPEQWRVSFRCFIPERAAHPEPRRRSTGRLRKEPLRFYSAWPLAERCQAMLRAFNTPAPYARRLARRLYAEPRRARAIVGFMPERCVSRDGFEDTQSAVQSADAHFRDSS